MNYSQFNAEDFIMDESFQQYCMGNNKEAEIFWTKWIASHPLKKQEISQAKELLCLLNGGINSKAYKRDELVFTERLKKEGIFKDEEARLIYLPPREKIKSHWRLKRWMAAAAILLAVVFSGVFLIPNKKDNNEPVAKSTQSTPLNIDIAPGGNKAILILANGRQLMLDSFKNGALAIEGNTQIIKGDGLLEYNKASQVGIAQNPVYNTVATPKGGQYQLVLADGSKVWLNAASSIKFPTAFTTNERRVEITGEAYFEIAHDALKPFTVHIITPLGDGGDVQVLGTHFNVMAYSDEESVKTTLLEGKVTVKKGTAITMLLPGQQAEVNGSRNIKLDKNADVDAAVAWKNGLLHFSGADVRMVGRQIGRWYDVDVSYSGDLQSAHLTGEVPRTLNLSQVIKVLQTSGIDVKTEGRKILITPKP